MRAAAEAFDGAVLEVIAAHHDGAFVDDMVGRMLALYPRLPPFPINRDVLIVCRGTDYMAAYEITAFRSAGPDGSRAPYFRLVHGPHAAHPEPPRQAIDFFSRDYDGRVDAAPWDLAVKRRFQYSALGARVVEGRLEPFRFCSQAFGGDDVFEQQLQLYSLVKLATAGPRPLPEPEYTPTSPGYYFSDGDEPFFFPPPPPPPKRFVGPLISKVFDGEKRLLGGDQWWFHW